MDWGAISRAVTFTGLLHRAVCLFTLLPTLRRYSLRLPGSMVGYILVAVGTRNRKITTGMGTVRVSVAGLILSIELVTILESTAGILHQSPIIQQMCKEFALKAFGYR